MVMAMILSPLKPMVPRPGHRSLGVGAAPVAGAGLLERRGRVRDRSTIQHAAAASLARIGIGEGLSRVGGRWIEGDGPLHRTGSGEARRVGRRAGLLLAVHGLAPVLGGHARVSRQVWPLV